MLTTVTARPRSKGHRPTHWDEPTGCATPRGWHYVDGVVVGFYLDYGPEHYRSPHRYCQPNDLCPECQPGNILAVAYPGGPRTEPKSCRYVETVDQARRYIESGGQAG